MVIHAYETLSSSGYKSLKKLRNLEVLDLSSNIFDNSILPFLIAATSLTTLSLRENLMDGSFRAEGVFFI